MLRILEKELNLEPNTLNGLLPIDSNKRSRKYRRSSFLDANRIYSNSFSFTIYIICIITSILLLNKYHLFLSKVNVITISPLMHNSNDNNESNENFKSMNKKNSN